MAKAKYLLVGSTAAYSGKSAAILGMTHQLQEKGVVVAYSKPLGTDGSDSLDGGEEDVRFIAGALGLPPNRVKSPLLSLDESTMTQHLEQDGVTDYSPALPAHFQGIEGELVLLEGPGTLADGSSFGLSVEQMAQGIDASILLVARFHSLLLADELLAAKLLFGDRLIGVAINDIPPEHQESVKTVLKPFLERQGIPVLGLLPRNNLLHSVSVRELTKQLNAKVLCRKDRLDLMVESLVIGAMNVNSALEYFRQGRNMAVVTGGDRAELQLAALETSTNCLILTGHTPPQSYILSRAEDLEIPILSVDLDTLTTVEIADRAFGTVRLQEPIKVECIQELMSEHFDVDRLLAQLGMNPVASAS
ncbi:phosphotransacetylase family protein [Lusitaniella coriacea]|uniref:phosphotransacetylase family protein n=1 Tax=Lusitaniella coriacea TaxID=1983105 RepID=UPI003CF39C89